MAGRRCGRGPRPRGPSLTQSELPGRCAHPARWDRDRRLASISRGVAAQRRLPKSAPPVSAGPRDRSRRRRLGGVQQRTAARRVATKAPNVTASARAASAQDWLQRRRLPGRRCAAQRPPACCIAEADTTDPPGCVSGERDGDGALPHLRDRPAAQGDDAKNGKHALAGCTARRTGATSAGSSITGRSRARSTGSSRRRPRPSGTAGPPPPRRRRPSARLPAGLRPRSQPGSGGRHDPTRGGCPVLGPPDLAARSVAAVVNLGRWSR